MKRRGVEICIQEKITVVQEHRLQRALSQGTLFGVGGIQFTRILLSTAWLIGAFVVFQNSLQAMGAATPALLASLFRQGVIFIPAVFIMKALLGVKGIIWAQPVADVLSLVVITFMLLRKLKKEDLLS